MINNSRFGPQVIHGPQTPPVEGSPSYSPWIDPRPMQEVPVRLPHFLTCACCTATDTRRRS